MDATPGATRGTGIRERALEGAESDAGGGPLKQEDHEKGKCESTSKKNELGGQKG